MSNDFAAHMQYAHDHKSLELHGCVVCAAFAERDHTAILSRIAADEARHAEARKNFVPVQYPTEVLIEEHRKLTHVEQFATQELLDAAYFAAKAQMRRPGFWHTAQFISSAAQATRNCGRPINLLAHLVTEKEQRPAHTVHLGNVDPRFTPAATIPAPVEQLETTPEAYASNHTAAEFATWMKERRSK